MGVGMGKRNGNRKRDTTSDPFAPSECWEIMENSEYIFMFY